MVGVVSAGYSKCHAVQGVPDVFTRVTQYDQWVRNTIKRKKRVKDGIVYYK